MRWYEVLAAAIATVLVLVVWRKVQDRREAKRFCADLRAMHREKIDKPGWINQPWQYEPGECKKRRLVEESKIEAYAASKQKPE
jgi:hypothetical protein